MSKNDLYLLLHTVFGCAYRDNQFDPQVLFTGFYPPELSVVLQFDSTKVNSINNDTFYALLHLI